MQNNKYDKPEPLALDQILPDGQIVDRKWLDSKGFTRSSVDYFLRSGKLEKVGRGVYRRPGPALKWEHIVYSLQEMGQAFHVGSNSALELQGYGHYLNFENSKTITLFGESKLPLWVNEVDQNFRFLGFTQKCFKSLPENSIDTKVFGHWDWKLKIATAELALFELLSQLKNEADFSQAEKYFESATTLRPNLVNKLLLSCSEIKTKRLFMWFAERHNHHWFKSINQENIYFGSGKRSIIKGGTLDKKYQITVPKEMMNDDQLFF